jgi:hypothetical protein
MPGEPLASCGGQSDVFAMQELRGLYSSRGMHASVRAIDDVLLKFSIMS